MPRQIILRVSLLVLLLAPGALAEGDDATKALRERRENDARLLVPQRGLGGSADGELDPAAAMVKELEIGSEGGAALIGYISRPKTLPPGQKCAVLFVFHANGGAGKALVEHMAQVSTERDPVLCIGLQFQKLEADGSPKVNNGTLAPRSKVLTGSRWLLDKVLESHSGDPDRVFVGGFGWGTTWASDWINREWAQNPATFPFRAGFMLSSPGMFNRSSMPPLPIICTVGEKDVKTRIRSKVRKTCNDLVAWGKPVQYHEIPGMAHEVNPRCLQIVRDVINDLGGPGALAGAAAASKPDPLPFPRTFDRYAAEVRRLLLSDRWGEAAARAKAIVADKKIGAKDKREVKKLGTGIERFAKKELPRLSKILKDVIKREAHPNPHQLRRFKGLVTGFGAEKFVAKKDYAETIRIIEEEYPPAVRERERRELMQAAWKLEAEEGQRKVAERMYERLASRGKEDGGISIWPPAALYRLTWWPE